jgi:acetolactate synthase I/II/III large subunit
MGESLRGADIVARSLVRLGCSRVYTLSGNHIMSVFDAALDAGLDLVHVRHEAAAVHMADAHGRLTGEPGVALVTGGPGHANAVGALYTALGAESPMVLLSGHAATWELGRGGFQEIRQADMASPVTKASWTARETASLGREIGEALRMAGSGRPGPVHVSLPSDLLDARVAAESVVWPEVTAPEIAALAPAAANAIAAAVAGAMRPLIVAGPQLSNVSGRALLKRLEAATGAPTVVLESPRGMADATLGAFPELARRADLLVLLGKALDFTVKWASGSAVDPAVNVIAIDPDEEMVERARQEKGAALVHACVADARNAAETLIAQATGRPPGDGAWLAAARSAFDNRPAGWATLASQTAGRLHPAEVFRALRPFVERDPDARANLRRRRVRAMGASHAAGGPPVDQRRGGLDRRVAAVCARGANDRAARVGVRRAGRRHRRVPYLGVRNRRAAQPAVCRNSRQRRALERGERDSASRIRREPHARLRIDARALRPRGRGVRRPRRTGRARGGPCACDWARPC